MGVCCRSKSKDFGITASDPTFGTVKSYGAPATRGAAPEPGFFSLETGVYPAPAELPMQQAAQGVRLDFEDGPQPVLLETARPGERLAYAGLFGQQHEGHPTCRYS